MQLAMAATKIKKKLPGGLILNFKTIQCVEIAKIPTAKAETIGLKLNNNPTATEIIKPKEQTNRLNILSFKFDLKGKYRMTNPDKQESTPALKLLK